MTDLKKPSMTETELNRNKPITPAEAYDRYGAMAYGIILQIVPQTHLAQEILVEVFASPLLKACNSYPFSYAVCIIKLARSKAIEARRKVGSYISDPLTEPELLTERVFELTFRQGLTPEEVAERLQITKSEVLKSFHAFFVTSNNI
ncbi:RNA polymerase sigma factor [Dyadobacter tibetensis]|uniref:RNA polymerase sigma factor n=1 Tax=Dyadobacter tibetensis TaxID=1211851 RepID=UPI00046FDE4B|nr:hypothetical protein [Dyadobacter tibetensis]